jgi:hypothetical protein
MDLASSASREQSAPNADHEEFSESFQGVEAVGMVQQGGGCTAVY